MRIGSTDGATVVNHNGVEYTADDHGMFDVPHDVGVELTRFPQWLQEHELLDVAEQARLRQARSIDDVLHRLDTLEQRVGKLEAARRPGRKPATAGE